MMPVMQIRWRAKYNERYQACVIERIQKNPATMIYSIHIAEEGRPIHAQIISSDEANNTIWIEQLTTDIIAEHEMNLIEEEHEFDPFFEPGGIDVHGFA